MLTYINVFTDVDIASQLLTDHLPIALLSGQQMNG